MSTLQAGLLDAGARGDDEAPRSESSQQAPEPELEQSMPASGSNPLQVAPWPADEGLIFVGPSAMHSMQVGTEGPAVCTTRMWSGAFTFGMMGGAWAGLTLLPAVGMPLAGGWFSFSCIMGIFLFRLAVQAVRAQTADGGFVSQMLGTSVSPQCSKTVGRLVMGIQCLQALFVVTQTILYCAGVVMVLGTPAIRTDMMISMLVGMIALFVGSFQVAAMIVAVITSCEVLHDCCRQLSSRASEATTAEQLKEVALHMRELEQTLQQAVFALRPIVLSVSRKGLAACHLLDGGGHDGCAVIYVLRRSSRSTVP